MSTLEGILQLLDKWPAWKRIRQAPERLDALEKRVAELESRLERAPGEACPRCGELTWRVSKSHPDRDFGDHGITIRTMKCEKCGFEEEQPPDTSRSRR